MADDTSTPQAETAEQPSDNLIEAPLIAHLSTQALATQVLEAQALEAQTRAIETDGHFIRREDLSNPSIGKDRSVHACIQAGT